MTEISFGYSKLDRPEVLTYLFHPRNDNGEPVPEGAIDHDIPVEEGVSLNARFFLAPPEAPHIIFFHGNGEIVEDYNPIGPAYVEHGLSLLVVDYRGYGKSDGSPSAGAMMRDAHTVFKDIQGWLKKNNRPGPLILMGRSLGSASAIDLAASHGDSIAGLIVESGFARTVPLLQRLGIDTSALGITEAHGFKNVDKIQEFSKPTLIIHAHGDQIIPVAEAELLQMHSAARSKAFSIIPGADHNTIMMQAGKTYFEMIKEFTDKIQGIRHYRFFRRKGGKRTQAT